MGRLLNKIKDVKAIKATFKIKIKENILAIFSLFVNKIIHVRGLNRPSIINPPYILDPIPKA